MSPHAFCADIQTNSGQIYRDAMITGHDYDGVRITYSEGVVKVPFENLPQSIQKEFGYDPIKVSLERQKEQQIVQREAALRSEKAHVKAEEIKAENARKSAQEEQESKAQQDLAEMRRKAKLDDNSKREREIEAAKAFNSNEAPARVAILKSKFDHEDREQAMALMISAIEGVLVVLLVAACYFLPAIVGFHKRNSGAILVFNLFLGWTFVGWVLALVWACTKDSEMDLELVRRRKVRGQQEGPVIRLPG